MKEKEILEFARNEPDWEETLHWIISEEGIDPWDVDLVELATTFSDFVSKWKRFNFTVPARIIIIMAILLRIKVELLMWEDQGEEVERVELRELDIDVSDIPELEAPAKRRPVRKVTAEELVDAFKKAFKTQERRRKRKSGVQRRVRETMPIQREEAIEKRIENLYQRIDQILTELKEGRTTFSELLPEWNRKEIVKSFFPLLRLSQDGRVKTEQEDYFEKIWIQLGEANE